MSDNERTFLRQLKITLLIICGPTAILIIWGLIGMYFGEKEMKETVKRNTEAVEEFRRYYMTTQDFWVYHDNLLNLLEARRNGDIQRMEALEKRVEQFEQEFQRKTRGIVPNL